VHRSLLAIARSIEPASRAADRDRRPKVRDLTIEKIVRDKQRLHRLFRIAATGRDGLVGCDIQVGGLRC